MSPEEAYRAHISSGFDSAGTWGISVSEVENAKSRVIDDSAVPDTPEHHAYIDMRGFSSKQIERASKIMKQAALSRGCLFSPTD